MSARAPDLGQASASFRRLVITAASALTAVGDGVEQTCTSIRAGISGLARHAYHEGLVRDPDWEDGEAVLVAPVAAVDPLLDGPERLHRLLAPVLLDLLKRAEIKRRDLGEIALLLALPALDDAVATWGLADTFLAELHRRTGLAFAAAGIAQSGHTGMIELLAQASALCASERARACIVAGVDSYLSADRLARLDEAYRLKSARNVDGFIPGEAATALLVEGADRRRARAAPALGAIAALGFGDEPETWRSERSSTGAGLCRALRAVAPRACPWVLCDLNGESYRAFEWGLVRARMGETFGALSRLTHPASSTGDVGAATGGVLVASALAAFQRGYAAAGEAVVWAASDGRLRAAARVAPA